METVTLVNRARDALAGMVGLVQLVSDRRYPDFPVDSHRVIEAQSCLNALEAALARPERLTQAIDFDRRVAVEQRLLDAACGKAPLPTREECRQLAHRLGIPEESSQGGV
jgi:hypothetical protein